MKWVTAVKCFPNLYLVNVDKCYFLMCINTILNVIFTFPYILHFRLESMKNVLEIN